MNCNLMYYHLLFLTDLPEDKFLPPKWCESTNNSNSISIDYKHRKFPKSIFTLKVSYVNYRNTSTYVCITVILHYCNY